jgi:hypothetical protein
VALPSHPASPSSPSPQEERVERWTMHFCGECDRPIECCACPGAEARNVDLREVVEVSVARDLADALQEAEKGIGSLLWVMNNMHNVGTPEWNKLTTAADEDARRALDAVRSALKRYRSESDA